MRVVGWNVRSLRDGRRAVVRQVRALDPDVLVLQEAPRLVLWRLSRWWLARACGLVVATPWRAAGNAVLVRRGVAVLGRREVRVPRWPGLHRRAGVVVRLDGLSVVGSHLDLREDARLATAALVRAAVPDGAAVLCADANDVPGSATWAALGAGLVDVGDEPTFPAGSPTRRIDAVLVRGVAVLRFEVVDVHGASDHRALLVEVEPDRVRRR